ncbi:MAG: alkane 1-monooxygenase [Williamsia sp.]|nr:alkane 1-monooxygenase [Williamsia sp.]
MSVQQTRPLTILPKRLALFNTGVMMHITPFVIYAGTIFSLTSRGWLCFVPMILTWIIIPVAELFIAPDERNLSSAEEEHATHNKAYDYILYMMVLLQLPVLLLFLYSMQDETLSWMEKTGRITAMGLFCGTCGINVGHELGHRVNPFEQGLAKASLLISLYMHNLIEHNRGHHKYVGTHQDPSTARYGEGLYRFWLRCTVYTYLHAWKIANKETRKKGQPVLGIRNEMIQMHLIEGVYVAAILCFFGPLILTYYILAALMGILLLQSVGYIEHYGLIRKQTGSQTFERVLPVHSWDSHHIIGRLLLLEVARHSDHHYMASRKYQVLRYHDTAPRMPTGYPGMILLALVPPAWFYVMNRRICKAG